MDLLGDTIAAIATAPGEGALAVVRVSGPDALRVAGRVFSGASELASSPANTLHHGWARWPSEFGQRDGRIDPGHEISGSAGMAAVSESTSSPRIITSHEISGSMSSARVGGALATALDQEVDHEMSGQTFAAEPESIAQRDVETTTHRGAHEIPGPVTDAGGATRDRCLVDEVVAAVFRAPHSYTREDLVELTCHGGRLSAERLLAALLAAGARLASPGEFTLRAFVHGRIDLAQAEAVADVIRAETETARLLALSQLRGGLSRQVEQLGESIADAAAEVEARVDFAEDVGGIEVPGHVLDAIERARAEIDELLASAAWGRAVREGLRVALVGRPNAGKSSLFNALLGESRAIVTGIAGTTRDLVSESIEWDGVRLTLLDTAGLRDGGDEVERLGIERAREALADSALVLWVLDASMAPDEGERRLAADLRGRRAVVAINKCDVTGVSVIAHQALADEAELASVRVSALQASGLDALRSALLAAAGAPCAADAADPARLSQAASSPAVTRRAADLALANRRHVESMERAAACLARATHAARSGAPGEIVALELREALVAVGEVTGRGVAPDLLDRIFARFCIGK